MDGAGDGARAAEDAGSPRRAPSVAAEGCGTPDADADGSGTPDIVADGRKAPVVSYSAQQFLATTNLYERVGKDALRYMSIEA